MNVAIVLAALAFGLADPPAQESPPEGQKAPSPTVSGLVVNGARGEVESSIDRRSYSVANDLAAQAGSVADALRNIPSVQIDASGAPSLRGDANVTVLIDGKPSSQFSGGDLSQALQAMAAYRIDRIEVMPNPPAEFRAQGSGGVINLITRKARGAGRTGSLRLTVMSHDRGAAAASLGYNSDRLSVTGDLTYQRMTTSNLGTIGHVQTDPITGNPATGLDLTSERWVGGVTTLHLGADYDLDDRTRLSGMARMQLAPRDTTYSDQFGQTDFTGALVATQQTAGREYEAFNNGEASLAWRRTFGEGHSLTVRG